MTETEANLKHFLFPGGIHVSREACDISTVLGSCVAVTLWDYRLKYGGMNHFMLPLWNGEGLPTPKYGNIAMEKLLEKMLAIGCRKEQLVAKVFGGGNINGTGREIFMIGDRNITLAFQMLDDWRIHIESTDVGGIVGRKVIMNTATGIIHVAKGKKVQNGS